MPAVILRPSRAANMRHKRIGPPRFVYSFGGLVLLALALAMLSAACAARPARLLRPNGVAVAADGSLYVMDRGNYRVVHLSEAGRWLGAFGRLGAAPENIYHGWNMALDAAGNIYLCNLVSQPDGVGRAHDGIKVFAPNGQFIREIGGQDYAYQDEAVVRNSPYGLDLDAQGRVYVADYNANAVRVFDAQGNLIARLFGDKGDGPYQLNGPDDVAVDERRSLLYVTDSINSRIQQFTLSMAAGAPEIVYRLTMGSYGHTPGQLAYPQYMVVDSATGRVYVGDMGNRRIQVFDPEGKFLAILTPPGVTQWQVLGLALGPNGTLYAADAFNSVVWAFAPGAQARRIEVTP